MQTHEQNLKKLRDFCAYAQRDPDGLTSDPQFRAFVCELAGSELQYFADSHTVNTDQLFDALIPKLRDYLFVSKCEHLTLQQFEMLAISWLKELSRQLCNVCTLVAHLRVCYPASEGDARQQKTIGFNLNGCDRDLLFEWLHPRLEAMARNIRSDHDTFEATDLAQETALQIQKSLHNYREGNFLGWCRTIMTRVAINLREQQKRAAHIQSMSANETEDGEEFNRLENEPDLSEDSDPLATVLKRELQQVVHEVIDKLPTHHQAVLKAYYFEKLSYEEIACTLRLHRLGTVKSRLSRAREALKKNLSQNHPEYFEEFIASQNQT